MAGPLDSRFTWSRAGRPKLAGRRDDQSTATHRGHGGSRHRQSMVVCGGRGRSRKTDECGKRYLSAFPIRSGHRNRCARRPRRIQPRRPGRCAAVDPRSGARESGVTVISFTINDVGNGPDKFMAAVKNIAELEHELELHPDALMKILRGSDIQTAKTSKRVGIVYGCQDTTMLEADLKNLSVFRDLGVRIVQL